MKNPALALGLVLFAIFLLSAGGHTYSPDEEAIVYVAQSFATRGDLNIPNPDRYPVVGGHRGVGGETFSGTGVGSSLLALPLFVAADQLAGLYDPHYQEFILRLALVLLFNSLITALTGILLYGWLRRLGASARVAVALVLVYAFSTMAWIYARSFYGEPLLALTFVLSGYALCTFHATRRPRWMVVAGLAAGLAALVKVQGVLIYPALGLYFAALELPALIQAWRSHATRAAFVRLWEAMLVPGIFFLVALAPGLLLTGYLNWIRFLDPFQTGRGEVSQAYPLLTGLYGELASSGKSIFLYAPPALLLFFALPRFIRQHAAEALLSVVAIVTFVWFHARLRFWSGDGAWGPRYLMPILPFFILPLGGLAAQWWRRAVTRAALVGLIAAGLAVNLLGVTVNWDTYIQVEPNESARYFTPAASPLLGQWRLLTARAAGWWDALVASSNAALPVRGFLASGDEQFFPRFLAPRATVLVKSNLGQPLELSVLALDYRPDSQAKRRLVFLSSGEELPAQRVATADGGVLTYRVQIPAARARWAAIDLVTLGSRPVGKSPMGDELGLHLQSLDVTAGGLEFGIPDYTPIPPIPSADPKPAWGWFFEPTYPQFDFYGWYLYFSGLDDRSVLLTVAAFSLLGVIAFVLGAPRLLRLYLPTRSAARA